MTLFSINTKVKQKIHLSKEKIIIFKALIPVDTGFNIK